ncbi:MAG: NAD(P)H-dependent oxidoreductase [Planctomycetaceae bacterium]|nr:NAD(P)H-dependent oxidoreductase [Planctomycetaceae bacterium]
MATLLYIESSPRKARSKSIAAARAFLEVYKASHPNDRVVTLDLWDKKLPEFDGFTIDAKYQVLHGQGFSPEQQQAWQAVVDLCDEFKAADKYVLSLPMWNFGIPYKLKHYIDVIAQPGQTFSYDPATGYSGLVTGKPMTVIYARGGAYSSDDMKGIDFQKGYLDFLLGFLGFKDFHSVLVEPTLAAPEDVRKSESDAIAQARKLAETF